jgi:hypothetical protein
VQAKAQTPEHKEVHRRHRSVEHKLGELARWHRRRGARYWGRCRALLQRLLSALVVNVKRVVHLVQMLLPDRGGGGAVRAAGVG